jgi:hypothetical protein
MELYKVIITVETDKAMDTKATNAFDKSPRFNALTAAIAIAINNFNRTKDGISAEIREKQ